ncbi:hypothetical protein B296_00005501 [Ensete ventricosum]|uniref:Uncharacterized protein n=1 Tax=Ensete ventricosum TaxID=4639 RepID=A0A427AUJ7_ENSVE|nr:hypothetical protein B296_00005501 [Ensete ventricosum]
MMLVAPNRGREDAIVGQQKREAGVVGHQQNNREGWGSNDAREINIDMVLVLVQYGGSRSSDLRGLPSVEEKAGTVGSIMSGACLLLEK